MSYAAEPYAQYVDDLLTALTGGSIRQEFRFLKDNAPFRLTAPGGIIPGTVQLYGVTAGAYRRFIPGKDYLLDRDSTIVWQARADGSPAADAAWPDDGSIFYGNFEFVQDPGSVQPLTDRNPGSITRLIAESFGREYATFAKQLESVYRSAYLDTAAGRDLDQLVSLVGVTRRLATFASGAVTFGRSTPAPADIFIPIGTKLSTVAPPAVVFETTESHTLRRGNLSVDVPIQSTVPGPAGAVLAQTVQVVNRPILGIEAVTNSQDTRFSGAAETDDALRSRAKYALEHAGGATVAALIGALTTIPGVREKDVQIAEDPLATPGLVKLNVVLPVAASQQDAQATAERAIQLIEEARPAGVRVLHNIAAPAPVGAPVPGANVVLVEGPVSIGQTGNPADLLMPVNVSVQLAPGTLSLTTQQKNDLVGKGEAIVRAFFAEAGIGEVLVYNKLVSQLMAVDGVLDVALEMYPKTDPGQPHHKNLVPANPASKPVLAVLDVEVGGSLIILDVAIKITLQGAGLLGGKETNKSAALTEIADQLRTGFRTKGLPLLTPGGLKGFLVQSPNYTVSESDIHYKAEYQDAGLRVHQQDPQLPITGLEQVWVRSVVASE